MNLDVKKYSVIEFNEWDNFVLNNAYNGTIYHTRLFLSYHKDKFDDYSIMIYDKKKLIAVFPCCKIHNEFYSHKGSTHGGIVLLENYYTLTKLIAILDLIYNYYDNNLYISISESIYFKMQIVTYLFFFYSINVKLKQIYLSILT